jgi:hypothetical protein
MMLTTEENIPDVVRCIRLRWIGASRAPGIDQNRMERTRHALKRLCGEGAVLRNEATVDLKGALWDGWVARETKWSTRTIDELRKLDDREAEWFAVTRLRGEPRGGSPLRGGSSPDHIAIHTIMLLRLNEIVFEIWGE